ncbi:unnamed protein product, partial [Ectocarpus sp. 6 AP-2014]
MSYEPHRYMHIFLDKKSTGVTQRSSNGPQRSYNGLQRSSLPLPPRTTPRKAATGPPYRRREATPPTCRAQKPPTSQPTTRPRRLELPRVKTFLPSQGVPQAVKIAKHLVV